MLPRSVLDLVSLSAKYPMKYDADTPFILPHKQSLANNQFLISRAVDSARFYSDGVRARVFLTRMGIIV